jgi:uroporphyrinogen decarboxylase
MRQAGRYLPEYQEIRAHQPDFIKFCLNPEAATAVTLQPVYRFNLDAAIIFADILTIPHALGHPVTFLANHGPQVTKLTSLDQVAQLRQHLPQLTNNLAPVAETVKRTRLTLPADKAVIGFSGAPWTLACYLFDDKPSSQIPNTLAFVQQHPQAFAELMDILAEAIVQYLSMQLAAGADAVQLFDSWATLCPPELWSVAIQKPYEHIVAKLQQHSKAPIILFPRAVTPEYLEKLAQAFPGQNVALSLSTEIDFEWATQKLQPHVAIQGNLDPQLFTLDDPAPLEKAACKIIELGQRQPGFVLNLGHGLTPETRLERVQQLAELVLNWKK